MKNPYSPPKTQVTEEQTKVQAFAIRLLRVNKYAFFSLLFSGVAMSSVYPDLWVTKVLGCMLNASVAVYVLGVILSFIEGFRGIE